MLQTAAGLFTLIPSTSSRSALVGYSDLAVDNWVVQKQLFEKLPDYTPAGQELTFIKITLSSYVMSVNIQACYERRMD
jgi:hypothetical protein